MSNNQIIKQTWITRILDTFGIKGYGQLIENPKSPERGASWSTASGVFQNRAPLAAMSVYGRHGYTYACISKASQDIAALPFKLLQKSGAETIEIKDHPVIDLINQPNSITDGELFREQFILDLTLTGNFYCLIVGDLSAPTSLFRLHPQNVRIIPDPTTMIKAYEYSDGGSLVEYPVERILHIRRASWNIGASGELYGTGAIEALEEELKGDIGAQKLAAETAGKGRPDILLSPKDASDIWGKDMRTEIKDAYDKMSSKGGAMVLSGQVQVDTVQLSPRDLEYQSLRTLARENISAVTGTPSTVLGLPDANYATARQATITYWENQKLKSRRLEKLLTKVARMFDSSLFVEFDFSGIDALQDVRTAQLSRIESHIINGVEAEAAYEYEGLKFPNMAEEEPASQPVEEPQREETLQFIKPKKKNITPDEVRGSVGDRNPTNYPEDGDNKEVALRNSNYPRFPHSEALALKEEWPEIWKRGGNILGNLQFNRLLPIAQRPSSIAQTETEEMAIRLREAWAARHEGDFLLAGVVAQIKWLVIGDRGLSHMRKVISAEKARLNKKAQKSMEPSSLPASLRTEDEKNLLWKSFIEKLTPLEREFKAVTDSYLEQAKNRYLKRVNLLIKATEQKAYIEKIDYSALLGRAVEEKYLESSIGQIWSRIWALTGNDSIEDLYAMTNRSRPLDLVFGERPIVKREIGKMINNILDTTEEQIKKIVSEGIKNGLSNYDIGKAIEEASSFSSSRSQTIAQTETTKAINLATVESYEMFEETEDIKIYKEWIDSKDESVREEHRELGRQSPIPVKDEFKINGYTGKAPSSFGVPEMDINCRCTIAPVIKD